MSMKYITSVVEANRDIKHVIEISGANVFVLERAASEPYGNKQGETVFVANNTKVSRDLCVCGGDYYLHLAQIVMAVEQVRFVLESTKPKE